MWPGHDVSVTAVAKQAPLDPWLDRTAVTGLALSLLVMVLGAANVPIVLTLWVLYHTLVTVGQHWWVMALVSRYNLVRSWCSAKWFGVRILLSWLACSVRVRADAVCLGPLAGLGKAFRLFLSGYSRIDAT